MTRTLDSRTGSSVSDLVRDLERLSDRTPMQFADGVDALLRGVRLDPASLAPYSFFSERHYTRNLIFKNAMFEMLTLCWWPGQKSSIHNHRDQRCWMLVSEGTLENQNYRVTRRDPATKTCEIEETTRCLIKRDQPLAVDMDEPVHQIRNGEELGGKAMSIHIYSRPFDTCEVYCPERKIYKDIGLTYWSVHGKVVAPNAPVDPCQPT